MDTELVDQCDRFDRLHSEQVEEHDELSRLRKFVGTRTRGVKLSPHQRVLREEEWVNSDEHGKV